jgi:metal-responsive CopG/Arc/MetJ family transcriptional regulator
MRTIDTLTISLPPAMAKQIEKVQKEEHRTRSELLREAWRRYFESGYLAYTPHESGTHLYPKRPRWLQARRLRNS